MQVIPGSKRNSGRRQRLRASMGAFCLTLLALVSPSISRAQETFTLQDLLAIGREQNPDLLSLRARREGLLAGRRDAGRLLNPELEIGAGEGEPFESAETKRVRELTIRQAIENPLSRHYRLGALDRQLLAAEEELGFGALTAEYEIRIHFYRILFLQELRRLAQLDEEALSEVLTLVETRARVGEVRELEAIRLRVEHMRARNAVQAAELELEQYRQHLNMILGSALPAGFLLAGELASDLTVPEFSRLETEFLPDHPLLRQATLRREAAEQEAKGSSFGWIPDPVLSATSARELDGDILTFGVGVQIPLWNQSRAASERDRRAVEELTHREEGVRLGLRAELIIHHNQLLLHGQTLRLFQEGLLEEADTSMEIADTSYREGEISFVEYLDARRTYQSIQVEFQQALYDWNRQLVELDRAAGGGIL